MERPPVPDTLSPVAVIIALVVTEPVDGKDIVTTLVIVIAVVMDELTV